MKEATLMKADAFVINNRILEKYNGAVIPVTKVE